MYDMYLWRLAQKNVTAACLLSVCQEEYNIGNKKPRLRSENNYICVNMTITTYLNVINGI